MRTPTNFKYNVLPIARKDPFELSGIPDLKGEDLERYYAGIFISLFSKGILQEPLVGSRKIESYNYFTLTEYLSKHRKEIARLYGAFDDGDRFRKGDLEFLTKQEELKDNALVFFRMMQKLSASNLEEISPPNDKNPLFNLTASPVTLKYGQIGDYPYFVFCFKHGCNFKIAKRLL
jgi:hypothetical protein